MVLGKVVGGSVIAILQAALFLMLGWATVPEIAPTALDVLISLGVMTLLAVALTSLGFLIAWRMDSTQGFHAIMSLFLMPMWLLSGAFFRHGADGLLGWIVAVNPLTYGVAALRWRLTLADTANLPIEHLCWGITIAFPVVMLIACWRVAVRR